jgi:hypothetical protein
MHRLLHTSGVVAVAVVVAMAADLEGTALAEDLVFLLSWLKLVTSCVCLLVVAVVVAGLAVALLAEPQVPVTLDAKYLILET